MRQRYRLAVGELAGRHQIFVECQERLFPLSDTGEATLRGAADLMPMLHDWARWSALLPDLIEKHLAGSPDGVAYEAVRFHPPVALPGKLICIGSNYHDHIAEMKIAVLPTYPYSFLKPATTLRGSGEAVSLPAAAHMIDWEAELAVIIGRRSKDLDAGHALQAVAGYSNFNDLSARDWVVDRPGVGIDWVRHKGFDGFGPFGPFMVPAEFVTDPQSLAITLSVNGQVKQRSNTAGMIFGVAKIIEHLTAIMTLEPGDVIATGTPAGAGFGRDPQEFLKSGDVIRMEVGDFGVLETAMV